MKNNFHLFVYFFQLTAVSVPVYCWNGVPVLIWNQNGHEESASLKLDKSSVPTFDQHISASLFKSNYLNQLNHDNNKDDGLKLIVLIRDGLSLEDFTSEVTDNSVFHTILDEPNSLFFANVESPLKAIEKFDGKMKIIDDVLGLDQVIDGDKVIGLDLGMKSMKQIGNVIESVMKKTSSLNVSYLLTGRKSSMIDSEEYSGYDGLNYISDNFGSSSSHYISRQILQSNEDTKNDTYNKYKGDMKYLHTVKDKEGEDCLYYYFKSMTITMKDPKGNAISETFDGSNEESSSVGSHCWELEEADKESKNKMVEVNDALVELKYTDKLTFTMHILSRYGYNNSRGYWKVDHVEIEMKGNDSTRHSFLFKPDINSLTGFSYSCYNCIMSDNTTTVTVLIDQLQIQPFNFAINQTNPALKSIIFTESFDCATFFTLPTFMGLFVVLLFLLIIGTAVHMLMQLNTMDRFEDPKSRPLMINASDD